MDVDELLTRAWEAVKKAGVPEPVQSVALREAVAYLRDAAESPGEGEVARRRERQGERAAQESGGSSGDTSATVDQPIGEDRFFESLAQESGVPESHLRDVLHLTRDGRVQVSPPTRDLGGSAAEQARSVIALVAGGRSFGLGERPVDAEAVRSEVDRKRCYQPNNFASKALGPMRGFNAGATKNEIRLTSKWVEEFKAAVDKARGESEADNS